MRTLWIILGVVILLLAVLVMMLPHPRVIARSIAPDGTEMRIVQQSGWHELPWFSTHFLYRKTNGQWRGFFYDHEDYFWSRSRVVLDTNNHSASFHRGAQTAIIFDWVTEEGSSEWKGKGDARLPGNKQMRAYTNYSGSTSEQVRF